MKEHVKASKTAQPSRDVTSSWTPWGPQKIARFRRHVSAKAVNLALRRAKLEKRD